ncbi:MAG: hypothetical protein Q8P76_01520 [bacterium]|nr:hypothetical protein [bacterium]
MPGVSNQKTEAALRDSLEKKGGFKLSRQLKNGETGPDIIAIENNSKEFYIEVIGYKKSPPARSRDFYTVFFGAISRIKDGAKHCVIALPDLFEIGLPARVRQYGRLAWQRIGQAFPELEIWLVDVDKKEYKKTKWNDWLKN